MVGEVNTDALEYEYEYVPVIDGLGKISWRKIKIKKPDFSKLKKYVKKTSKQIVDAGKKTATNVWRASAKINPTTVLMRNSLRVFFNVNFMAISTILAPALLTEEKAKAAKLNMTQYNKRKKIFDKVVNMYRNFGGNSKYLKKDIARGAKRKAIMGSGSKFKISKTQDTKVSLSGIDTEDGLGAVITLSAALATAGTFFATIWGWVKSAGLDKETLTKAKNTISKTKDFLNKNKKVVSNIKQVASDYSNYNKGKTKSSESSQSSSNSNSQLTSQRTNNSNFQLPSKVASGEESVFNKIPKPVLIGGAAVVVGGGIYLATRNKGKSAPRARKYSSKKLS